MEKSSRLRLHPHFFTTSERDLFQNSTTKITTFCYESGVEAVRIVIGKGEFIWLPFLGQQLWDWKVEGKTQKFSGFMEEPSYNRSFLENYGAFLIHCGITGMGNPKAEDTHLHHGELPSAYFNEAWIDFNHEDNTPPISLGGIFQWKVPFKGSYSFSVQLNISSDGMSAYSTIVLENTSQSPLEYMYLGHINFDFKNARLIEYENIPFISSQIRIIGDESYKQNPSSLLRLDETRTFDPEIVAVLNHAESDVIFTSRLKKSDGSIYWVSQETKHLDHTVLWMTHNQDRGACGFALPSTAGPEGKTFESQLGNVKILPAGESVNLEFSFGSILPE